MFVEYNTIKLLCPEIILVVLAAWIYIGGTISVSQRFWTTFAVLSYVVAGLALALQATWPSLSFGGQSLGQVFGGGMSETPSGPVVVDYFAYLVRWLALGVGLLATPVFGRAIRPGLLSEVLGTLMLLVVGVMLVGAAGEIVFLFVALELVSIPTYVLLFLGRRDWANREATAKYFFLSILSSAVMLYGFSFLYGLAGTTELSAIRDVLLTADVGGALQVNPMALIALVLVLAGLGFKIAAVPFHFYAPDVYQGTTSMNAAILAIAPKAAGMVALIRLLLVMLPTGESLIWQLTMVLAILTMTLGNICALWQRNVRRLMAYSSIAHSGYMLIGLSAGLAAGSTELIYGGLAAVLFYLLVYVVASLGTFAALSHLSTENNELNTIEQLSGLGRARPVAAAALALFMFSLAGIPPLAGFWGKLTLFGSALSVATVDRAEAAIAGNASGWFITLAIIGVLNAAIAAAYYLRIVAAMYFRPAVGAVQVQQGWGSLASTLACAALVLALGVIPGPGLRAAAQAEKSARYIPRSTESAAQQSVQPEAASQVVLD